MKCLDKFTPKFNPGRLTNNPEPAGIVETNWLKDERKPGSFAQEAAKSVLGNGWTPPEDFDFRDRKPPHIPAPEEDQESDDIVNELRKRMVA